MHELGDELLGEAGRRHGRHELLGHRAIVLGQVTDTGPDAIDLLDLEAGRLPRIEPARVRADDDVVLDPASTRAVIQSMFTS